MELRQLYFALEIAKCGSFSKAANNLFITQPYISQQINALENEIGKKLFTRNTHKVSLTAEGKKFCNLAEDVTSAFDILKNEYLYNQTFQKTHLNISAHPFFAQNGCLKIIKKFFDQYDNIISGIVYKDTYDSFYSLDDGTADFAFIKISGNVQRDGYKYIPLMNERLTVIASENSSLKDKDSVTIDDIKDYKIVTGMYNSCVYQEIKKLFDKKHITPNISLCTLDPHLVMDTVIDQCSITFMTEAVADSYKESPIVKINLEPVTEFVTYLVYKKDRKLSKTDQCFIDYVVSSVKNDY